MSLLFASRLRFTIKIKLGYMWWLMGRCRYSYQTGSFIVLTWNECVYFSSIFLFKIFNMIDVSSMFKDGHFQFSEIYETNNSHLFVPGSNTFILAVLFSIWKILIVYIGHSERVHQKMITLLLCYLDLHLGDSNRHFVGGSLESP